VEGRHLTTQYRNFVAASGQTEKKKNTIEFVVPSEWDLDYMKKFDIPSPTPEQIAKAIPPPLEVYGRVGELASDLFQIASVYNEIDQFHDQLMSIKKFAQTSPAFATFLEDKSYTKKEIRGVFEDVFKNLSPVLKKFGARMVENSDFHRLLKMIDTYDELVRAHKKEIPVILALPKIPPPERLELLKQRLTSIYLPRGAHPVWDIQTRPNLGSGFVFGTPERTIDTSYAKKLNDLKGRLAVIHDRVAAAELRNPLPQTLPSGLKPSSFQDMAKAINKQVEERATAEERHYKDNFVSWV